MIGEDKKRVKREIAQRRMQVNRQKSRYKGKFKYDEFASLS